jgi:hypothetical protein
MEQTQEMTRYNNHSYRVSRTQQRAFVCYVMISLSFLQTYRSFAIIFVRYFNSWLKY